MGKQSSSFGQFGDCFSDSSFGATKASSHPPKFHFFYETQREVFILLLPFWYNFMSSLPINCCDRTKVMERDPLSLSVHDKLQRHPQPGVPEPKANNRPLIRLYLQQEVRAGSCGRSLATSPLHAPEVGASVGVRNEWATEFTSPRLAGNLQFRL